MNIRESHEASKAREESEELYIKQHPLSLMDRIRELDTEMKLMLDYVFNRSPF
jgi:hypothetical protein